jgi:putative ABC transport system permease protein
MRRLLWLFRRRQLEQDLHDELREHLVEKIDELTAQGYSSQEACEKARLRFGNPTRLAERTRDVWNFPTLAELWHDVRYAARVMRKSPGFTFVAVLSLALGVGANTIIFSALDHVLLRPLPYLSPEELVTVWSLNPTRGFEQSQVSPADFYDWQSQNKVFQALAAYTSWPVNLTNVAEPRRVESYLVTSRFFDVLGVSAERGRTFTPDEDQPGKEFTVVISHRLWNDLGAPENIIGRTITLNGSNGMVAGVMPASFGFPAREADVWMPLDLDAKNRANRDSKWLRVIGRLAPWIGSREAASNMEVIARQLAREYPATNAGWGVSLVGLRESMVWKTRTLMLTLQIAVAFLLLTTCANLANLLLARGSARSKEIALRAALGAGRMRILRQLAIESGLLAALGGAAGLALAYAGVATVRALGSGLIPRIEGAVIDGRVLLFTLAATCVTAMMFGLIPALHSSRVDLRRHVYSAGRGTARGVEGKRSFLVSAEIALASILLTGAFLLVESLANLNATDPGFRTGNILTMRIQLNRTKYPTNEKQITFFHRLSERVRNVPGIESAGFISDAPLGQNNMTFEFVIEGVPANPASPTQAAMRFVTPDYLSTMAIPLLAGRSFTPYDAVDAVPVAVINQTMAKRYWPGASPIGKRLRLKDQERWITVEGVVADIKHLGLQENEGPSVYVPHAQKTESWVLWMTLAAHTAGPPLDYVAPIRSQVLSMDKDQPLSQIAALDRTLAQSIAAPRLTTSIISGVSLLSLLMAIVGVYGVLAYTIAQRIPEIGIRMALGASHRQIFWLLLRHGLVRVGIGIGAGMIGAWALTGLLASLLFGVKPRDPVTFAAVALVLLAASLAAVSIPARRALGIDPATALRID